MSLVESTANARSDNMDPLVGNSAASLTSWFNFACAIDHLYAGIITHGFHYDAPTPDATRLMANMSVGDLLRIR